jgi:cytidine deaminase
MSGYGQNVFSRASLAHPIICRNIATHRILASSKILTSSLFVSNAQTFRSSNLTPVHSIRHYCPVKEPSHYPNKTYPWLGKILLAGGLASAAAGLTFHIHREKGKAKMVSSDALKDPSKEIAKLLPPNPFVLDAKTVEKIIHQTGLDREELLKQLIPVAKSHARPSISNYCVGAAALGISGSIYLGVNLEFPGFPLNQTVHGEQFLVTLARLYGETEIIAIALSAAPCGHCRQFLNEIGASDSLQILIPNQPAMKLSVLLPQAFGPKDLGLTGGLLTQQEQVCKIGKTGDLLTDKAFEAADASYAPYSLSPSGVAIQTKDGSFYRGSYLDNAAFNPSLSPLQAALVELVANQRGYDEIEKVVLIERKSSSISQTVLTQHILKSIAPEAEFKVIHMNEDTKRPIE